MDFPILLLLLFTNLLGAILNPMVNASFDVIAVIFRL